MTLGKNLPVRRSRFPTRALGPCLFLLASVCIDGQSTERGNEPTQSRATTAPTVGIELRNGLWLRGDTFETRTFYMVDGYLSSTAPDTLSSVMDLEGGFVIPPFGEAHSHRPDGWPGTTEGHAAQFLEHGIFYVLNPNSFPSQTERIERELNGPHSIDVVFSNGGLTPPGSHVTELYARNLDRGVFPEGWTLERLDGEGYFVIRDLRDVEAKWPALIAGRPDFVKIFMGFSEEYEARRDDPDFVGKRGIDPALVPGIVERAHTGGLRVAAHIENAADFRLAVTARVDIIAHMPASWRVGAAAGYSDDSIDRWLLEDEDAVAAARADAVVVAHVFNGFSDPRIDQIHKHNLALLKKHGVKLAIGSDNYRQTSLREAVYLQSTGLFSASEVLRIATRSTAQAIFPHRRIGVLEDGYEASFLVVDGDPVRQPLFAAPDGDPESAIRQAVERIRIRVKQGERVDER